jgi:hypothetical protein
VSLTVDTTAGYPDWVHYSIHLMSANHGAVFRYDNVAHHPELESFPDHKHLGSRQLPVAHPRPTIAQLVREILGVIEQG